MSNNHLKYSGSENMHLPSKNENFKRKLEILSENAKNYKMNSKCQ